MTRKVTFLLLLGSMNFFASHGNHLEELEENVCRTPECLHLVNRFQSSMNTTVDPCDNFYEYACGNFNSTRWAERFNVYHVSQILNDTDSQLQSRAERLAQQYFLSCTDRDAIRERGFNPFLDYLKEMGGWGDSFNASRWTLQTTLETAHLYNQDLFFVWGVRDDPRNSSRKVIALDRSFLNMSSQLQMEPEDDFLELLQNHLAKTLLPIPLELDLKPIVILESKLRQIPKLKQIVLDSDVEESKTRLSIAGLQKELPFLNWLKFFNRAFSEVNITVDSEAEVVVEDLNYFKQLSKVINDYMDTDEERSILASYLNFQMLYDLSGHAINVPNENTEEEVDKTCLDQTRRLLPSAVSAIFIREFMDRRSMTQLEVLADTIRFHFGEVISFAGWLDTESLKATLEQVKRIQFVIGYQKFLLDKDAVDSRYADLSFRGDGFFEKVLDARLFRRKTSCKQLTAPLDANDLTDKFAPTVNNAFFTPDWNTVVVPVAFAQMPHYNMFFPKYTQFGGMGFVIGHELVHSLYNAADPFAQVGDLRRWWEGSAIQRFNEKAQCLVDQFTSYSSYGMQLDGNETLVENIADFGGLRIAYEAHRSSMRFGLDHPPLPELGLNHEQLFFLSFAQELCADYNVTELRTIINNDDHTPDEFRVIGNLRNMPEFAEAFSCSNATAMNPEKKCDMW